MLKSSDNHTIYVWEIFSKKEIQAFHGHIKPISHLNSQQMELSSGQEMSKWGHAGLADCTFSPQKSFILSYTFSYTVTLWDCSSKKQIVRLQKDPTGTYSFAISPDERFEHCRSHFMHASISKDGQTILAKEANGIIRIWEMMLPN
ncbi:hypothetical protein RFI_26125 [Reticulomyxa filosa]|uniref:Uncharacterized protein n=1 Tax=Reticulomyxa filosa TaxID=46433 RepID=X6MB57_RETFI|nr:hypothetical protein RFI_26125 [Reticulomyxa filosa]|eukprot:ETO11248.1 hypothetical protein RFI_26125 [Reticulomyxa filosa]